MHAYYNEIDPFAAAWLRELIKANLIADGEVDERSIADVQPGDLRGFTQCHFFAGIGGWSYALRLAGWPDDREVWTGSCPCQPFSSAGANIGGDDPRHLWPTWFRLIRECGPDVVFGEQVESAVAHGWIDAVFDDLEGQDYAAASVGLPAPCIGAFHGRARLWFVAESYRQRCEGERLRLQQRGSQPTVSKAARRGEVGPLDYAECQRAGRSAGSKGRAERSASSGRQDEGRGQLQTLNAGAVGDMGDTNHAGSQGRLIGGNGADQRSPWAPSLVEWIACRDGKARAVEPGAFPLAHGIPKWMGRGKSTLGGMANGNRIDRLRGYGNAIVPQVAQVFIEAYIDARG